MPAPRPRALLIDLNNFARYPTLAVGHLVASLRRAAYDVEVLSPLHYGVAPVEREGRDSLWNDLQRRVYFSTNPLMSRSHDAIRSGWSGWTSRPRARTLKETQRALDERRPDVLLLSAYLDHYSSVVAIAALAADRRIPVLLGGPFFNVPGVAESWSRIRGVTAVVGAEVDLTLPDIVKATLEGGDLTAFGGMHLPDGRYTETPPPLSHLDELPIPDLTDFPWHRYPNRVLPIMTGRGCSWGRCTFCADVITANGRAFRSRSIASVLGELRCQSERHVAHDVIFLDIKLNSSLDMWHGLIDGFQRVVPGGKWVGTVHVARTGDNGLSRGELKAARAAGMRRTSFGLETGSQRLNDRMAKGTSLDAMSEFLRNAHEAGISVRTTAMVGYPGETADDVIATASFLRIHARYLDHVKLSRFKAIPGTRFQKMRDRSPERFESLADFSWDHHAARAQYRYEPASASSYRRAVSGLLREVYAINRAPIAPGAAAFDGVM